MKHEVYACAGVTLYRYTLRRKLEISYLLAIKERERRRGRKEGRGEEGGGGAGRGKGGERQEK